MAAWAQPPPRALRAPSPAEPAVLGRGPGADPETLRAWRASLGQGGAEAVGVRRRSGAHSARGGPWSRCPGRGAGTSVRPPRLSGPFLPRPTDGRNVACSVLETRGRGKRFGRRTAALTGVSHVRPVTECSPVTSPGGRESPPQPRRDSRPPPQAPRLIPVPREGRKRISFQQKKSSETAGPDFPQRGTQQVWRVCRRPCRSLSPPTGGRGSAEGSGPLPEMARACRWHSRLSPSMRRAQPPRPHRQAVLPGPESERRGPRPSGAGRPRLSKQCDRCSPRLSCPCQIPAEWKF